MTPNKTISPKTCQGKFEPKGTAPPDPSDAVQLARAETQTDCVHKKTVLKLSIFLFPKHNFEEANSLQRNPYFKGPIRAAYLLRGIYMVANLRYKIDWVSS